MQGRGCGTWPGAGWPKTGPFLLPTAHSAVLQRKATLAGGRARSPSHCTQRGPPDPARHPSTSGVSREGSRPCPLQLQTPARSCRPREGLSRSRHGTAGWAEPGQATGELKDRGGRSSLTSDPPSPQHRPRPGDLRRGPVRCRTCAQGLPSWQPEATCRAAPWSVSPDRPFHRRRLRTPGTARRWGWAVTSINKASR